MRVSFAARVVGPVTIGGLVVDLGVPVRRSHREYFDWR